jgi:putative DNA primase/helicase
MMNSYQVIEAFKLAMAEAGIKPPDRIEADGQIHRFHIDGHKPGSQNGAYLLHLDGARPAGYFEDFKTGLKTTWKADGPVKPLTPEERQQSAADRLERQQQQLRRYEKTAEHARYLLNSAKPVIGKNHLYLLGKNVNSYGLYSLKAWSKRIKTGDQWSSVVVKDPLLVPLTDLSGKIWNIQAIFPQTDEQLGRDKDFLGGGRLGGLFHAIGQPTHELIICEGYATGASLHEATGLMVLCAMSAGNLEPVARDVRKTEPGRKIFIAADNDEKTPGNPGVTAAKKAARAVGGYLAVPPIAGDFNDYANLGAVLNG